MGMVTWGKCDCTANIPPRETRSYAWSNVDSEKRSTFIVALVMEWSR